MFEIFITNYRGDLTKHLSAPLLQERRSYLEHLHQRGATKSTLQSYAMAMLYFVQISSIQTKRSVSEAEIEEFVETYMNRSPKTVHSKKKRLMVRYRVRQWLTFCGMYRASSDTFYGKEFVESYCNYLFEVKGYSKRTCRPRFDRLKLFMQFCDQEGCRLKDVTPGLIDKYILHRMGIESRRTIVQISSVLRDFVKYGAQKGWCRNNLWQTIKVPRTYKHEDIPAYLPWNHVTNIIERLSKRTDGTSIRDYSIMLLFVVYGLRDSEVTNMKLSDIDWKNDIIHVRRAKSYRKQELPLIGLVGNAIYRYIKDVRPNNSGNEVIFLRRCAPIEPLKNMYSIVRGYLKEEGVDVKHYGAHSLRHSCATFLINHGYSYKLVADILGHQQYDTVNVYAKVDFSNLKKVADMNWEDLL